MATVKVKFRPSSIAGNEGTIYYQVIHERRVRQLLTDYHIFPGEWCEQRSNLLIDRSSPRLKFLLMIRDRIRWDLERIGKLDKNLSITAPSYTAEELISEFRQYKDENTIFNFMESVILRLRQNGHIRTSETYRAALNSFRKFRNDADILLDCIDSRLMEDYESWLRGHGLSTNTISFYTRILRAVYNRAVEQEIIDNRNPFRRVYTGIDKTVKRALPLATIRKIKSLDLSMTPSLDYARDMFLMSFYLRGMSFIDMAYLRKSDLVDGYISYHRRKTGQRLTIAWTPEMRQLLAKYPENRTRYLLPILRREGINERCAYRNASYNINHNLKKIAARLGLSIPLTLYVARHSWASAAHSKGIPVSVISEGMGHDSEATTRIYLASLDTTLVDRANSLILKSLK